MSSQRSEYRDLCSMPPSMPGLVSSTAAQGWNWQQGKADSLQSSKLLEDDKQGLYTRSEALNQGSDQWITSHQRNKSGANLGSTAESPASLSPSPSPLMSPGKPVTTSGATPRSNGSSLTCSDLRKPDSCQAPPPIISKTDVIPNYCAIAVVNDSYLDGTFEGKMETRPSVGMFPMQHNRVVQRTMSDTTHLTVPASLQLPDKYPGKDVLPLQAAVKYFTVEDKQRVPSSTNIPSSPLLKKEQPVGVQQSHERNQLQPQPLVKAVSSPAFSDVQPKETCHGR